MLLLCSKVFDMKVSHVKHVANIPYLETDGSVLNVPAVICAHCVTMVTSTVYDTASIDWLEMVLKGIYCSLH